MQLCKKNLAEISKSSPVLLPGQYLFELDEKVLQFGTGVLLRGLIDVIIDKANKKGKFNGRVVVVKSTETGTSSTFQAQDCLYTVAVRGMQKGNIVMEQHCIAAISRVLSAKDDWQKIVTSVATNAALQIIVSNTTEIGLALQLEDIFQNPPHSFPGKLLAILYHRFIYCKGALELGLIIIPTELIPDNGKVLLAVVLQLAQHNKLDGAFMDWLNDANYFCSSLVDRIVPGKLSEADQSAIEMELCYRDDLLIIAEPYHLWAIETDNEKVKNKLSFAFENKQVVIAPAINNYRELKLRLLNGTHTFSCGLAHLAGFETVKQGMNNEAFANYVLQLMKAEILPVLVDEFINREAAETFANDVIDRYNNNFIAHKWLNITLHYSAKMMTRNLLMLNKYLNKYEEMPEHMALGMAAHILFMRCYQDLSGNYYGSINGIAYTINDMEAEIYCNAWQLKEPTVVIDFIWNYTELYASIRSNKFKLETLKWLQYLMTNPTLDVINMVTKTN